MGSVTWRCYSISCSGLFLCVHVHASTYSCVFSPQLNYTCISRNDQCVSFCLPNVPNNIFEAIEEFHTCAQCVLIVSMLQLFLNSTTQFHSEIWVSFLLSFLSLIFISLSLLLINYLVLSVLPICA